MYRVYNIDKKRWEKNIYLSPAPYSDLFILEKNIFGKEKLIAVSDENYVIHRDIELRDRNGNDIYEGDCLKAKVSEDKIVEGIVAYAHELSAYVVLCFNSEEYYTLGTDVCEFIEITGNVFDNH